MTDNNTADELVQDEEIREELEDYKDIYSASIDRDDHWEKMSDKEVLLNALDVAKRQIVFRTGNNLSSEERLEFIERNEWPQEGEQVSDMEDPVMVESERFPGESIEVRVLEREEAERRGARIIDW